MRGLTIVVTYNGMKWYDRCFSSLRASTVPVDIYVFDNASTDGTVDYIRTRFPEIILHASDVNLGFGQGNNKGMRYALDNGYEFVFLLNQDAWLARNDAIEQLLIAYKDSSHKGILSPIHFNGSGERITSGMKKDLAGYNSSESDLFSDLYFKRDLKIVYKVDYACAAAWFIPVETIKEIGGFDPLFFHYGEDDNYMHRLLYHNLSIGVCPFSGICHDIEHRGDDYSSRLNNWKKNLLVEMSNINKPLSVNGFILKTFLKSFSRILTFRFKAAILYMNMAIFVCQKRSVICLHNQENKKKGNNWL
ncbi:MAG TPA: glycosyltransferase family 2 protein [Bacteroidales bacterium]|nr:glycosyltransferase family 2 protein [Bacteroidales bacterium]